MTQRGDRLVVLGYHNVETTPAMSARGADAFTAQVKALRRVANIVPLHEALDLLAEGGALPPRAVALTFDDGYRDNVTRAAPILARLGVPATYYLVPGFLSREVDAWWERLGWAISRATVPSVEFGGRRHDLGGTPARRAAHLAIEADLKVLTHADRHGAVESLVEQLQPPGDGGRARDLYMDWDEARRLVALGGHIGSHTMQHAILARESAEMQRDDLVTSRTLLQDGLDTPVTGLAYPNGKADDYDEVTQGAARAAGYEHAVTTWGTVATRQSDRWAVARRVVSTEVGTARLVAAVLRRHLSGS